MSLKPILLSVAIAAMAAPALAQTPVWTFANELDPAELALALPGEPATVSFACRKDSGQIIAAFPAARSLAVSQQRGRWLDDVGRPAPWPVSVTLTAPEAQTTIPGEVRPDAQATGSIVSVEFSNRAPVAEAFAKTGELRFAALGEVMQPPPPPRRELRRFLSYCR